MMKKAMRKILIMGACAMGIMNGHDVDWQVSDLPVSVVNNIGKEARTIHLRSTAKFQKKGQDEILGEVQETVSALQWTRIREPDRSAIATVVHDGSGIRARLENGSTSDIEISVCGVHSCFRGTLPAVSTVWTPTVFGSEFASTTRTFEESQSIKLLSSAIWSGTKQADPVETCGTSAMCIDTDISLPTTRSRFQFQPDFYFEGAPIFASRTGDNFLGSRGNDQQSVGLVTGIDERGAIFSCSGVLIQSRSVRSLFLTANHCVPSNTIANTIEVFWHFAAPWCGRKTKALGILKRSIGAALVKAVSQPEGDMSLLELRSVPQGVNYAAWTDTAPPDQSEGWALHHPSGQEQRLALPVTRK